MLLEERVELTREFRVPAGLEVGIDPVLQRREAQLFEAGDLRLGEGLEGEVAERRAAPECERLAQLGAALLGPGPTGGLGEEAEAVEIELLRTHAKPVPRRLCLQDFRSKHLPKLRDEVLQ